MSKITFKIANRGEGKTRWLLEKAHELRGESLKFYSATTQEYVLFCEKYLNFYNEICRVEHLDIEKLTSDDIVLIDDLFSISDATININYIKNVAKKLYITLEGNIEWILLMYNL